MTNVTNDPALKTALPVQVPGQQYGSIEASAPSLPRLSQLDVINAARKSVQQTGTYPVSATNEPLYTKNGIMNGYQESRYLPSGAPLVGPQGRSSTSRAALQGFTFVPLTNPSIYGGSISDNIPPPASDTYVNR